MKLRIRSPRTKETIRIEISDSSSLTDLKTLISNSISASPDSINLSLNQKDPLISNSPNDSLKTLGLTSGDLLFYHETLNLPLIPQPRKQSSDLVDEMKSHVENSELNENLETDPCDMEVETTAVEEEKPPFVPYFLKRVMESEKEEMRENLDFVVVAAHAVFLESGFVACNGDGIHLPKHRNLSPSLVSLQYTVPELLDKKDVKVALLKFNVLKNHVSIYGNLQGECDVYRVDLEISKVMPFVVYLSGSVSGEEEKEIFRFWKSVKDGLCLPLLIDVCHRNGLPPPPCFACLPTELKYMILERLPGDDVAKTACTSSEMRYLSSDEELWKQKFYQEFSGRNEWEVARLDTWKAKYKFMWIRRRDFKKSARVVLRAVARVRQEARRHSRRSIDSIPLRYPSHVGVLYDRFPDFYA